MKKLLPLVMFLVVASAAFGATCSTGTLASYIALGSTGCAVSNLNFSNFYFNTNSYINTGSGPVAIDPANITLSVVNTTSNVGFSINTSYYTVLNNNNNTVDINLGYTVTALAGTLQGAAVLENASVTGTGDISVSEYTCVGASYHVGCTSATSPTAYGVDTSTALTTSVLYNGNYNQVSLNKDIFVSTGSAGTAHLSDIQNTETVPEPMTMSLLGVGLLGLGFFGRRVRK